MVYVMNNSKNKKNSEIFKLKIHPIWLFALFFFIISLGLNFYVTSEQQFSYMSFGFLHGKAHYLLIPPTTFDSVYFNGEYYWPLGPFPSVVLLPFTLITVLLGGNVFNQGFLQIFLTLGIFWLVYKLAKRFKYSSADSAFLAFGFCFATVYHIVALMSWSWYFSHTVVVFLLFVALHERYNKSRYWLLGIIFGLVFLTRFPAGFSFLYIAFLLVVDFVKNKTDLSRFSKNMALFLMPIILSGVVLLAYNHARFGSVWNSGYGLVNAHLLSEDDRFELLNYGLFNPRNIPTNLYYYFVKTLDPILVEQESFRGNTYVLKFPFVKVGFPGTSLFIVAPILLYIFTLKYKDRDQIALLLTSLFVLFIVLMWFWPGYRQTGPRYTLDFLPLAYVLVLYSFKDRKLSNLAKAIIVTSAIINVYFFANIFFETFPFL